MKSPYSPFFLIAQTSENQEEAVSRYGKTGHYHDNSVYIRRFTFPVIDVNEKVMAEMRLVDTLDAFSLL